MRVDRNHFLVILVVSLLVTLASGCGRGKADFTAGSLKVSVKLPPGWQRGEPRASGGYRVSSGGMFFFEDVGRDDPSGDIVVMPFEGASLTAYVDDVVRQTKNMEELGLKLAETLGKAAGGGAGEQIDEARREAQSVQVTKRNLNLVGLEAIEVTTTSPRSTVQVYVRKGDKVVVITFGVEKEDFPKYEKTFRDAVETIEVN